MSGDWKRVHRVRGVCSGSPENHWVTRLSRKTERRLDEDMRPPRLVQPPKRGGQTAWAGLTTQEGSLTARVAAAEKL
jgi:hypothetical protein